MHKPKIRPASGQPYIYLSGGYWTEALDVMGKYRCYSYAYVGPKAFFYNKKYAEQLATSIKQGCGVMLDSGAYSFQKFMHNRKQMTRFTPKEREKLRDKTVEDYAQFCKEKGKEWDWYATFDYVRHSPTVYKIQKQLEKLGIRPVPVFHGDMELDYLKRYCEEGYKIVCLGGIMARGGGWSRMRRYFDIVFNLTEKHNVKVHGLAVTSLSHMFQSPFYSVDSATWAKVAAYGKIIHIDSNRCTIGQLHVGRHDSNFKPSFNTMPKEAQKALIRDVESYGHDFSKMREDGMIGLVARARFNADLFSSHISSLKEVVRAQKVNWEYIL